MLAIIHKINLYNLFHSCKQLTSKPIDSISQIYRVSTKEIVSKIFFKKAFKDIDTENIQFYRKTLGLFLQFSANSSLKIRHHLDNALVQ